MAGFLTVFLFGALFILISICCYKFLINRKVKLAFLRFVTSGMILFTFTVLFYDEVFLNWSLTGGNREVITTKGDGRVFLNSDEAGTAADYIEGEAVTEEHGKITAYFDNTNPARGTITNLIVTGPKGGRVTAICQYKGYGRPYIMDIGQDGKAIIPVMVDANAEPGFAVVVDISISLEGKQYKLNSVFTPR